MNTTPIGCSRSLFLDTIILALILHGSDALPAASGARDAIIPEAEKLMKMPLRFSCSGTPMDPNRKFSLLPHNPSSSPDPEHTIVLQDRQTVIRLPGEETILAELGYYNPRNGCTPVANFLALYDVKRLTMPRCYISNYVNVSSEKGHFYSGSLESITATKWGPGEFLLFFESSGGDAGDNWVSMTFARFTTACEFTILERDYAYLDQRDDSKCEGELLSHHFLGDSVVEIVKTTATCVAGKPSPTGSPKKRTVDLRKAFRNPASRHVVPPL